MGKSLTFDNCAKSIADALQAQKKGAVGLLYDDDKVIDVELLRKMWADPNKGPGCDLIVCRVGDATGAAWKWLMS